MKPLELKLQAFGTFPKEITIDFTELSKDGIFLIVGNTGSGKTTIFDAICYALYGVPNGSDRNANDFRSHFADKNTKTFVQLKFEHFGKIYTVYRTPVTKETTIKDFDGNILTEQKKANVDNYIKNLIGLTAEQFKQIVMIAQGEFKAFLLAKSDKKGEILNTVFGTQKFIDFKKMIEDKSKIYKKDFENYNNLIMGRLYSIRYTSSSKFAKDFDTFKLANNNDDNNDKKKSKNKKKSDVSKPIPEILNILNEHIQILKEEEKSYIAQFDTIKLQCENLSKKINQIDTLNSNIKKRDDVKNRLEFLLSQEDVIKEYQKDIDLFKIAESLKNQHDNYKYTQNEKLRLQKELNVLCSNLERCSKNLENINDKKHSIEEKYPLSNEDILNYLNNSVKDLSINFENVKQKGFDLKNILDSIDIYTNELKKLNSLQSDYEKTSQIERDTKLEYTNQYNRFMYNMVGIIAEQLVDGCRCPVCGSIDHPQKAIKCDGALSKEQLDNLKLQSENIEKKSRELQNRVTLQMANVDSLHNSILERVGKYGITSKDNIKSQIISLKNNISMEYLNINNTIKDIQKDITIILTLQDDLNKFTMERISIETSIKNKRYQLEEMTSQYEKSKNEYFQLLEKYSIPNEDAHLDLLKNSNRCSILENKINQYYIEKSSDLKILEDYSKLVGDATLVDTSHLKQELNSLNTKRDSLLSICSSISESISDNTTIYNEVSSMMDILMIKRQKYLDTSYLYNVANGTIATENGKISFDGFVQAYYFEKVLECANKKIQIMSGGRYTLIRKEIATSNSNRTNLDIEVFDAYTCTKRNASTLSGGESFMASLSLALGLSEIVQNSVGGIQIDAMFIDEGFGTLDNDLSLQQAMKILDNLANNNRIVGIISHVSDLQEHINKKLYVEKTENGSYIRTN